MARSQSVASRTQWGHQGCGYGSTRNDVALAPCTQGDDTCSTAAEGYEYIIERGRRACQQLRLCLAERRQEKINSGRQHTDEGCYAEVLACALQQVEIIGADSQPHAHDGAHEWRDKHGTNDDSCRVDVQSQRSNEDGEDKHPEVGSPEAHPFCNLGYNRLLVLFVGRQTKVIACVFDKISYSHNHFMIVPHLNDCNCSPITSFITSSTWYRQLLVEVLVGQTLLIAFLCHEILVEVDNLVYHTHNA